ncbi:hypothetical protein P154DRAFT_540403 [Amniculicola lignicola CBS 123094]|uniref:Uncharacterized protein n=1 Tax=Amniculicola lignicola CBS 123094 TaxID=1392246 RepID=A0A6A5VVP0_9PLEO|nr:hypothetical protein P154DRAFT_540403 [Amniculicola lignicola CBS 123094]
MESQSRSVHETSAPDLRDIWEVSGGSPLVFGAKVPSEKRQTPGASRPGECSRRPKLISFTRNSPIKAPDIWEQEAIHADEPAANGSVLVTGGKTKKMKPSEDTLYRLSCRDRILRTSQVQLRREGIESQNAIRVPTSTPSTSRKTPDSLSQVGVVMRQSHQANTNGLQTKSTVKASCKDASDVGPEDSRVLQRIRDRENQRAGRLLGFQNKANGSELGLYAHERNMTSEEQTIPSQNPIESISHTEKDTSNSECEASPPKEYSDTPATIVLNAYKNGAPSAKSGLVVETFVEQSAKPILASHLHQKSEDNAGKMPFSVAVNLSSASVAFFVCQYGMTNSGNEALLYRIYVRFFEGITLSLVLCILQVGQDAVENLPENLAFGMGSMVGSLVGAARKGFEDGKGASSA